MQHRSTPLWVGWVFLVWAVSFPWTDLTADPQWNRIHVVPFTDPADNFRDMAGNILLFLPFGYSAGRRRPLGRALGRAVILAMAISASAEAMQLFSTVRYPSATDVTAAVVGSLIGALLRLRLRPPSAAAAVADPRRG